MILFALIIGTVFSYSFASRNERDVIRRLKEESDILVEALVIENNNVSIDQTTLVSSLTRISVPDVRVFYIGIEGNITYLNMRSMSGAGMMRNISRLNANTLEVLESVFDGQQVSSENINGFFNSDAITLGTPVMSANTIVGGLFVSATTQSIGMIASAGSQLLFVSLAIALIIAVILALILSRIFTKPLEEATRTIQQLSEGNYHLEKHESSQDELGVLQSNLFHLSTELQSAKDARENLEKMRQNFIADISHELRTPVTIIRGLTEGLQDNVYQQKDVLPQILKESKDMERLINDLLELSKLEDPDFKVDKIKFEYHDLINDVVRSARELLKSKNQKLVVTQDEQLIFGFGDTQRLKQMCLAIIHNASKFSHEGSVISIALGKVQKDVVISISDQGLGMSEDKVKELFVRYKKDTENNPDGNGLGLLIVEKIASKHDIKIDIISKVNEGTTFRFICKEKQVV